MAQARTAAEVKEYIAQMARDEEITQAEAEARLVRYGIHRRNATVNYAKSQGKKAAPKARKAKAARKSKAAPKARKSKKAKSSLLD
jgi:hypothetical protein